MIIVDQKPKKNHIFLIISYDFECCCWEELGRERGLWRLNISVEHVTKPGHHKANNCSMFV